MTIDFTNAVHEEFAPGGFLAAESLLLRRCEQDGPEIYIEFEATALPQGIYAIRLTVPAEVGDGLWRAWDEEATDVVEWTRWGISVPIVEAYQTTSRGLRFSSEVKLLAVTDRTPRSS